MKTLLLLTYCWLGLFLPTTAQGKINVNLNIRGTTAELEAQVRSYFAREFRALGDVEVTESSESIVNINIIIKETRNKLGQNAGYVISLAIIDKTQIQTIALAIENTSLDPEVKKMFGQSIPDGGILMDHILLSFDSESLTKNCKDLVAQIDGTHFEKLRKYGIELQKRLQSHRMNLPTQGAQPPK